MPSGQTWVGYFDEGVYGNFGWGGPGPPPLGACGLARFTPHLQADWRFPTDSDSRLGAISDCYALNLDGETAWTCYYSDYPVVRIQNGTARAWHGHVTGAAALIAGGEQLAQFGGYGPDRDRAVLSTFGDDDTHPFAEYRLTLPGDQPLPPDTRLTGRGPDLHAITGQRWYRLSLDDLHSHRPP